MRLIATTVAALLLCAATAQAADPVKPVDTRTCSSTYGSDRTDLWLCRMGVETCFEKADAPTREACETRLFNDPAYAARMRTTLLERLDNDPAFRAIAISLGRLKP